jgi:membrane protease YdiL (CAAX protease family)
VTESRPRIFTAADGRELVAVPFWNGVLSALGGMAIGLVVAVVGAIVLVLVVIIATGRTPSTNPGHPLTVAIEVIFYAACGSFAWWRLRTTGRNPLRKPTGHDIRVILIGIAALVLVRTALVVQLMATHQTKHVQTGLEHFDVVTKNPTITAIGVALTLLTLVVLGPIVEEIVFRGLLFGALAPRLGVLAAALITALLFGAIHGDLVLFPALAALGFIAALAYAATGNLVVAIALHTINNSLGAAVLVTKSLQHH